MKTEINGISYTIEESFNDILLITKGGQDLIIENGYADLKRKAVDAVRYFYYVQYWTEQNILEFVSENFENAKPLNA